jgi:hypothetical protein
VENPVEIPASPGDYLARRVEFPLAMASTCLSLARLGRWGLGELPGITFHTERPSNQIHRRL